MEEAEAEIEKAVALLPGRPDAYYQRARLSLLRGRRGEAAKDVRQALRLDPGHLPALAFSSVLEAIVGGEERASPVVNTKFRELLFRARLSAFRNRWRDALQSMLDLEELVK